MSIEDFKGNAEAVSNAAKFAGEVLVPGGSEIISGNLVSGVGTFLAVGAIAAVLAPTTPLLAGLAMLGLRVNSFSHATKGQYLWSNLPNPIKQRGSSLA